MRRRTLELYYVENSYPSHTVGAGVTKICSEETIKIVAVSSVHTTAETTGQKTMGTLALGLLRLYRRNELIELFGSKHVP